jgi:hypothetical protein
MYVHVPSGTEPTTPVLEQFKTTRALYRAVTVFCIFAVVIIIIIIIIIILL